MVHNQIALIAVIYRPVKFHAVNELLRLYRCRKLRSDIKLLFRHIHVIIKELRITVIQTAASHNRNKLKALLTQIIQSISLLPVHFTHQYVIQGILHFRLHICDFNGFIFPTVRCGESHNHIAIFNRNIRPFPFFLQCLVIGYLMGIRIIGII